MPGDMVASGGKRALLVGINSYPKFPALRQLHGCVNDVNLMRATLRDRFGFPDQSIAVLLNEQATREGILAAMKKLLAETGQDDVVVLFYSGHGSQMSDREGDEPDFFDETIVPYDSGRVTEPNRDISDDEIYLWLCELGEKTGSITLWFDCCNSGSITRDVFGGATRSVPRDDRPTSELPPSPIPESQWPKLRAAERDVGPSGWQPKGGRHVLLAACGDEETANEYPPQAASADEVHGALTFFLHQELMSAGPGTTYRDVFDRAKPRVTAAYPDQHPQFEGNRDRALFGLRDLEPARFLDVQARAGNVATLGGGKAHGVQEGSRWAVYPAGTKQASDPASALGTVQISAARGLTSDAQVSDEVRTGAIVQGCRAFEVEHTFGDRSLAIELAPAPAGLEAPVAALEQQLAQSKFAHVAKPGETVHAKAVLVAPRSQVKPDDPAPQLGAVAAPTWAVVGGGGQLLMRALPAGQEALLRTNLETIARAQYLLAIQNPGGALKGKIEVTLLRKRPGGDWQPALPEADGQVVYRVGDQLAFSIVSHHPRPVFFNALDFDFTSKVGLVYPPAAGANEALESELPFEFGKRQGQEMFIQKFPADYPRDEGQETLKLIVATREIDFSWMRQEGMRGIDRGPDRSLTAPEEWTTLEVAFTVKKQ